LTPLNDDFVLLIYNQIGFWTCWQRDIERCEIKCDRRSGSMRWVVEEKALGGDGGCTAAVVKSMEQPRRRNATRLRAACFRWRDVYRFRRRYWWRDVPETVGRNDIANRRFQPVTITILLSRCHRHVITLLFCKHMHTLTPCGRL